MIALPRTTAFRPAARAGGLTFVALGLVSTVAGLALPWTRAGSQHPDLVTIAAVALLGPLLSLLRLTYARVDRRHPTLTAVAAAVGALGAAVVAGGVVRLVDPPSGVGLGGPLAVLGGVVTAIGWLLIASGGPAPHDAPPPKPRDTAIAVVTAIALVAVVGGFAIRWYTEGRFVDARTVEARSGRAPARGEAGTERWRAVRPGSAVVGFAGQDLVVRDASGVRSLDASSGNPRWYYLRRDVRTLAAGLVGQTVVTVFATADGVLVTGHETGTGRERWARWYASTAKLDWLPTQVLSSSDGRTALVSGSGPNPGDLVALDAGTGAIRWSWRPERDGGGCDVTGLAASGTVVGVALRCRAQGVKDLTVGLSTADGRERWTWAPEYTSDIPRGAELAIATSDGGFLVSYGIVPRHGAFVDAADGTVGTRHAGTGALVAVSGTAAVYLEATDAGATATAIDTRTGTTAWRVELPWLAGWRPAAGTASGAITYLLLTATGGAVRVVAVETASGKVAGDLAVACATACNGPSVAAGEPGVVVATVDPNRTQLALFAFG